MSSEIKRQNNAGLFFRCDICRSFRVCSTSSECLTRFSSWKFWKDYASVYCGRDPSCDNLAIGFSISIMIQLTQLSVGHFLKQKWYGLCIPPRHPTLLLATFVISQREEETELKRKVRPTMVRRRRCRVSQKTNLRKCFERWNKNWAFVLIPMENTLKGTECCWFND